VTSALCRYRTSALPVSREILDRHAMVLAARILRLQAIEKEHLLAIGRFHELSTIVLPLGRPALVWVHSANSLD
jgi:hypothetical protein